MKNSIFAEKYLHVTQLLELLTTNLVFSPQNVIPAKGYKCFDVSSFNGLINSKLFWKKYQGSSS